ncbi:hypothetical protein C9381_12185 [Pantoea vagans]|uniref:Uncharacterized protein n=1 Tax=Pantoea vagans TaxID=470934 RepID=A0AAN1NR98_9GAMM|nr:hypothetical protein C9381_12185 [Pantoea vagans]
MKREHRLDSQAEQGLFASCLRDIDSAESVSMRLTTKSFPGSKVTQLFRLFQDLRSDLRSKQSVMCIGVFKAIFLTLPMREYVETHLQHFCDHQQG